MKDNHTVNLSDVNEIFDNPEEKEVIPEAQPTESETEITEAPEGEENGNEVEQTEDEGKSEETKTTPDPTEKVYKIGDRTFKSEDELIEYAKRQSGYNGWMTGILKKARPELFKADGTIDTEKVKSLQEKASDAVETIADEDSTDEEVEKAKKLLKSLGVVMNDDPEWAAIKGLKETNDKQTIEESRNAIDEFEKKHPLLKQHYQGVAEIMERNGVGLDKGWRMYKAANDIAEEPLSKNDTTDGTKSFENVLPTNVQKTTGSLPVSKGNDFMDDLINSPGI